jgi:hypothetical protein
MKTLVIQLDRTEDAGSIRDKVTWGKASRVLLVWPVNYELFDRKIDLVMIKRTCTSQGSRLGIVCDDPVVCEEAEELQIPIFESVNKAMRKGWDRRRRRWFTSPQPEMPEDMPTMEELRVNRPVPDREWQLPLYARILILLAGVLAVLSICLFILPSAEVKVYPMSQAQELTVDFTVESGTGGAANPGILHGEAITTSVESEASRKATGKTHAPDAKARGTLSFTNLTATEINIKAKTIVFNTANPPVRYTLLNDAVIPGEGTLDGVEIEAIYAGESGNTLPNTITRMDGETGLQVQMTNPSAVSGGTDRDIPAPSTDDIVALRADLQTRAVNQAEEKFTAELKPEQILLASSIRAGKIENELLTPQAGEAGVTARIKQSAEYTALVIDHRQFAEQAGALLKANRLLPGWQLSTRQPMDIQIISQEYDRVNNSVKLKATIKGQMIPIVDMSNIRKVITGRERSLASAMISILVLTDKPASIETWPSWMPILPLIESRINVTTP